ncbi:MAG: ATPase associated with various cellular 5 [Mucilaginibacter sp.]|nr:ATPase associated with various cellular 5 [Mucilaginibacter sp.]
MRQLFQKIITDYPDAYKLKLPSHELKKLITIGLPKEIEKVIVEVERYKVKGTVGVGGLPAILWIAIFDILVTQSAQSGYYPVFLFRDDMSGFYLSLNQGVTTIVNKLKYKEKAEEKISYN